MVSDALHKLVDIHLKPNLPIMVSDVDVDEFRLKELYTESSDKSLRKFLVTLRHEFYTLVRKNPLSRSRDDPRVKLSSCINYLEELRLIKSSSKEASDDDDDSTLVVSKEEARYVFMVSRPMDISSATDRLLETTFGFYDFVEGIARICKLLPLPTEADLERFSIRAKSVNEELQSTIS